MSASSISINLSSSYNLSVRFSRNKSNGVCSFKLQLGVISQSSANSEPTTSQHSLTKLTNSINLCAGIFMKKKVTKRSPLLLFTWLLSTRLTILTISFGWCRSTFTWTLWTSISQLTSCHSKKNSFSNSF